MDWSTWLLHFFVLAATTTAQDSSSWDLIDMDMDNDMFQGGLILPSTSEVEAEDAGQYLDNAVKRNTEKASNALRRNMIMGLVLLASAIVFFNVRGTKFEEYERILHPLIRNCFACFGSAVPVKATCVSRYGSSLMKVAVADTPGYGNINDSIHVHCNTRSGSRVLAMVPGLRTQTQANCFKKSLTERCSKDLGSEPSKDDVSNAIEGARKDMEIKRIFCPGLREHEFASAGINSQEDDGYTVTLSKKGPIGLAVLTKVQKNGSFIFESIDTNASPDDNFASGARIERLAQDSVRIEDVRPGSLVVIASEGFWNYVEKLPFWARRLHDFAFDNGVDYAADYLAGVCSRQMKTSASVMIAELVNGEEWRDMPVELAHREEFCHPSSLSQLNIAGKYSEFVKRCGFSPQAVPLRDETRWFLLQ